MERGIKKDQGEFQSLFLWIFRSYTLTGELRIDDGRHVSILVLMDLSFLPNIISDYL